VHRYEGTIKQFTRDGIMALFGAPVALENAPERALRAALGMQAALGRYAEELARTLGIRFRMRIGVHTGPVVVGRIGDDLRMDYTAVGDTTNLAARLQQAAEPGAILVSDHIARLVEGRFVMHPVGPLTLKGKAAPVSAREVLRVRARAPLVAPSDRALTPLVGRSAEIATLEALHAHARDGRGQMAFVVGDAGIGKSRLVYEFHRRLSGQDVTWLVGRCVSFGREIPLLPILDIVRSSFGIEESDGEATIIESVRKGAEILSPDLLPKVPYLLYALAVDPGDPAIASMDPHARRYAVFDALKQLMLAGAARRPLVVLIEDLHWIDQPSEESLQYVADAVATSRVLLIATYRPGYRNPLGERSYSTRLALQPLSPQEAAAMTGGMLETRDFPVEIRELVAKKAEGNPFFVEEVTKSLLEMGALRRSDRGYELSRELSEIVIPDTIQGVIMARIDRLGEDPKRAIQIASVIGREFAVRLLERVSDRGEHVRRLVGDLRALELIYEKSGLPEIAYMFKHALTHDVAYQSLLVQRRKELHRMIGRAVEELYADRLAEYWEVLAHHYYEGEEWSRAFDYLVKAGDKALASFSNREAVHFYDRALEAATRIGAAPERVGEVHGSRAHALFVMSDFESAAEGYDRALEAVTSAAMRARLEADKSHALVWAHRFDDAVTVAEKAVAAGRAAGDGYAVGTGFYAVGFVRAVRGDLEGASPCLAEVDSIARQTRDHRLAARAGTFQALMRNWRGEY
ncbi:MAG: ATP-binding protein, partial [Candidatus Binatia bacterium]